MDFTALDQALRDGATDLNLDNRERFELRELGARIDTRRVITSGLAVGDRVVLDAPQLAAGARVRVNAAPAPASPSAE